MSTFAPVRNPVRGKDSAYRPTAPTATEDIKTIVATSGSTVSADTTPDTGNAVEVVSPYTELMVYVGELPIATEKAVLYVKVGSASVQAVEVLSYGCVAIKAVAGQTVAFGAATLARNSSSLVNGTLTLKVIPHRGKAQVAPSGVTGTINLDRCSPNLYEPTRYSIVLQDEYQRFSIAPASRKRDIFIMEYDLSVNATPIRHIHIPENQTVKVDCRYRCIFIASIDTATLDVTCPTGALLSEEDGIVWEPPFTASKVISVSTVAAFKTAMNDASDNVDVVLAPGTYDLSASGNQMNITNYNTAMAKNRRIRSSTGVASDVLFQVATPAIQGMQWIVSLSSGKSWILQDVSFNMQGAIINTAGGSPTGMLNLTGPVHMCRVTETGAISTGDTSVKWLGSSTVGDFQVYIAWCSFSKATDDLLASNGDGAGNIPTAHFIGCYIDGNGVGVGGNAQILTNHNSGEVIAWGSSFGNLTTGNPTRIASDGVNSPAYLMYCRAYPENFVTSIGINVSGSGPNNPSFLHFCDFQAAGVFDAIKSVVCSTLKAQTTGRPMAYTTSTITSKWTGCDLYGPETGTDFILDAINGNLSISGVRVTHRSPSTSNGMIRLYRDSGGPWTVSMTQVLFKVLSGATPFFNIATASEILAITNAIFATGGSGVYTINGAATGTSTIAGSFLQKPTNVATAPTNWDARFSGTPWASLGSNMRSISGPNVDANDVPVSGGTLQGDGVASIVGSTDIYGRPFLGGEWSPGAAQLTTVVSGQFLYPLVWI